MILMENEQLKMVSDGKIFIFMQLTKDAYINAVKHYKWTEKITAQWKVDMT